MTRRALMFANVYSGGARHFPYAVKLLQEAGITVTSVRFDLTRDGIVSALENTPHEDVDLILACGGDGTVGSVVDALVGKNLTLGIIAAGTSNNFARTLGITPTIRGSIAALLTGTEIAVDVGQINGHYFAHAAIMGLNVEFARRVQSLRTVMGRFSYPIASLMVYRSRRKLQIQIEGEITKRQVDTYQLALLTPRPGGRFGPERPKSDQIHTLRALIVHDLRLRTIMRGLPRIFFQRHLGLPGADSFELETGYIVTRVSVPVTLDGEIKTQTPAEVRVVPNGLRVIAAPGRDRPSR